METIAAFLLGLLIGLFSSEEPKHASNDANAMSATCTGVGPQREECIIRLFKDTKEASIIRGKLVYQHYCFICHGHEYDGKGRAAKLHTPPPTNLKTSGLPFEYVHEIIKKGGEGVGRYKGMPPWNEQLTEEQLQDVSNFVISVRQ